MRGDLAARIRAATERGEQQRSCAAPRLRRRRQAMAERRTNFTGR
jgi:hypothetical protein